MNYTVRGWDKFGAGHFGAPRGARTHQGVDLVMRAGDPVLSVHAGKVTKLGYVYKGSGTYRYVEVTNVARERWRYMYVKPGAVALGNRVEAGAVLGTVQSLQERYPGITDHVHLEIIKDGDYLDPTPLLGLD